MNFQSSIIPIDTSQDYFIQSKLKKVSLKSGSPFEFEKLIF